LSIGSRFLALPPNFSPIIAVALLSGFLFANRKLAMLIPITAMLISDIIIGIHSAMIGVYISFIAIVFLGTFMKNITFKNVILNSIIGGVIFFVITNFAVFAAG
jgi:hypothetical protein